MNYFVNSGNLEIRVDRRTELLGIMQIISDYKNKYPHLLKKHGNKNYIEEIEEKFNKYKDHKAIILFNEIINNYNFCYDVPVSLFLQLNDDFTFSELDRYPFKERLHGDDIIIEMLEALPDFVKEIEFNQFYNNNETRYRLFINNIKHQIDNKNLIDFMFNYYGIAVPANFIVNLIPFQTCGNYGTKYKNNIYSNISGKVRATKEEEIYPSDLEDNSELYLLYHEFSHSFINPLTDKYHIIIVMIKYSVI